jgi:hypothetical protein
MLLSALFICFVGWLTGQLEFMATLGIGQPALELATAFPQATPASIFPPSGDTFCSNSSYFQFQTSCRESLFYKSVASKRLGLGIHLRFLGAVLWVHTVSDYYQLDGLLSPEDVALRERVRDVMETHVAPVMTKVSVLHETVALVLMQAREREFKVQWSETVQEECELEYI